MSEGDTIVLTFPVAREFAGQRLDVFIRHRIPRLSRTRAQEIIRACAVREDGSQRRPSDRVREGEIVTLKRTGFTEPAGPRDFEVLFEDDDLFIIDKPTLMAVHPTASYHRGTVKFVLEQRYGAAQAPRIVHRLDRETSGVLVCAKHIEAERKLKQMFEARATKKTYVAIVHGAVDADEGEIDAPLSEQPHERLTVLMEVKDTGPTSSAYTRYRALRRSRTHTLLALYPTTGRQHQLRVHLAHIGHPIVGDKLYGAEGYAPFIEQIEEGLTPQLVERLGHERHALHAYRIEFPHPRNGTPQCFDALVPFDLRDLWRRCSMDGPHKNGELISGRITIPPVPLPGADG